MAYPPPSLFPGLHGLARPEFAQAAVSALAVSRENSIMSGITSSSPVAVSSYHQESISRIHEPDENFSDKLFY
jgi:hypothetical protein